MALQVLDPIDAVNLAFAFEIAEAPFDPIDGSGIGLAGQERLFILYLNPERYSGGKAEAVSVSPVQGRELFFNDRGHVTGPLLIRGRFGQKSRIAHDRNGSPTVLSGPEQFEEFDAFLDDYRNLARAGAKVELRFHSFKYHDHYAVVPVFWNWDKDNKSTRLGSPRYQLRMQQIRRLDEGEIPVSLFDQGVLGAIGDVLGSVEDTINELTVWTARIRATVSIPLEVARDVDEVIDSLDVLFEEFGTLGRTVDAVTRIPDSFYQELLQTIERLTSNMEQVLHDFQEPRALYEALSGTERNVQTLATAARASSSIVGPGTNIVSQSLSETTLTNDESSLLADLAYTDRDDVNTSSVAKILRQGAPPATPFSQRVLEDAVERILRYNGWLPYRVRASDTIISIASRELGDPTRWLDIATVNGLISPFIGFGDRLAAPGSLIRIPTATNGSSIPFEFTIDDLPGLNAALEQRLFGVDLRLEYQEGLLDLVPNADKDDVETIGGFDNFIQRIEKLVLSTERGSNILFPLFGIRRILGQPDLPSERFLLLVSMREALGKEGTIRRIVNEDLRFAGTAVTVEYDVETISTGLVKLIREIRP